MIIMRLPLHHPAAKMAFAGLFAASLAGCAPNLAGTSPNTNTLTNTQTQTQTDEQNGVTVHTSVVDADVAKANKFTYFSFETGAVVTPATPSASVDWDLAFKSTTLISNSGVSGAGTVSVKRHAGADFDALTQADASGYLIDAADSDDTGTAVDNGFLVGETWYNYSGSPDHIVTPKDHVYVVRANSGKFYKMKVVNYYDAAGTARYVTFKWAELTSPYQSKEFNAPASAGVTYLSLRTGEIVSLADETAAKASLDWDLALSGTKVRTNSGTSGHASSQGGAFLSAETTITTLGSVPDGSFTIDTNLEYAGQTSTFANGNAALKDWYNYAGAPTHAITPKPQIYVVKTADGRHAKLRFVTYSSGKTTLEWVLADGTSTTF
jgi:hypothetical protein